MSVDEQHRATERAGQHRANAEAWLLSEDKPALSEIADALAAVVHLLLAIEDRLTYGYVSILDGTISCEVCRVILLEANVDGHYRWHQGQGNIA